MKLIIDKKQIDTTPEKWLQSQGYAYIQDRKMNKESFVRRLGAGYYPRLHLYIKQNNSQITFDLHLDQKQASYAGQHMHNAEYEGPVVEAEINRLKDIIINNQASLVKDGDDDLSVDIGHGELGDTPSDTEEKKGFWKSVFG